jgi:hypothetical protein
MKDLSDRRRHVDRRPGRGSGRQGTYSPAVRDGATLQARLTMTDAHAAEIGGIVEIIEMLAALPEESRPLHVRVVKSLLWIVTEFRPGFPHKLAGVRWRTPEAHALVLARQPKTVRHEHVIERDWMARVLLDHPGTAADALWQYPCCLVTVEEHARLSRSPSWGWRRYLDAGVDVIDAGSGMAAPIDAMADSLEYSYMHLGLSGGGPA